MNPQDLQAIQAKIGRSFFQAFYPTDYRGMKNEQDKSLRHVKKRSDRLRVANQTTSNISTKLARVLNMMAKEIDELMLALDNVQNAISRGDMLFGDLGIEEAVSNIRGGLGLDLFRRSKAAERARKLREEEARQKKAAEEEEAKKNKAAEEEAKQKKAAAEEEAKAKSTEEGKAKSESTLSEEAKAKAPKLAPEAPKAAAKMPAAPSGSVEALADAAATGEKSAVEAFKQSMKNVSKPETILGLLQRSRNAAANSWINRSSSAFISKILGSKIMVWGGRILGPAIEAWSGWEDYLLANYALESGLITKSQWDSVVRHIVVSRGARALIGTLVAEIAGAQAGALGATIGTFVFPGIGTVVGGAIGAIGGAITGWFVGTWAADIAVDLFLGNTSLSSYLKGENGDAEVTPPPTPTPVAATAPQQGVASQAQPGSTTGAGSSSLATSMALGAQIATPAVSPTAAQAAPAPQTPSAQVPSPSPVQAPPRQQAAPMLGDPPAPLPPPDLAPYQPPVITTPQTGGLMRQAAAAPSIVPEGKLTLPGAMSPEAQVSAGPSGLEPVSEISAAGTLGTAEQFLGKSEGADRDVLNQFINQYFGPFDVRTTPWCSAFTNAVLAKNGLPGTGSAMAKSFLNYGQEKWSQRNPDASAVRPGDIAVFDRGGSKGHVAFVKSFSGNSISVLGGNQSDASGGGGAVTVSTRSTNDLMSIRAVALATGGIVSKPTLALIGEGGEPEYVVPHSKAKDFASRLLEPTTHIIKKKHTRTVVVPILMN